MNQDHNNSHTSILNKQTPQTIQNIFQLMQEKILNSLQNLLPLGFNFSPLQTIFDKKVTSPIQYAQLILNLLQYYIKTISENLITKEQYNMLENLTQKLQNQIRNHIKLQHEIKLYLDIKLRSLQKYKQDKHKLKDCLVFMNNKYKEAKQFYESKLQVVKDGEVKRQENKNGQNRTLKKGLFCSNIQTDLQNVQVQKLLSEYDIANELQNIKRILRNQEDKQENQQSKEKRFNENYKRFK